MEDAGGCVMKVPWPFAIALGGVTTLAGVYLVVAALELYAQFGIKAIVLTAAFGAATAIFSVLFRRLI
jgi:hypothetical protein